MLAEHQRGPEQREDRLGELDLADLGDAAEREAAVPGEEAEEHRDERDVGEAKPLGRAGLDAVTGRRERSLTKPSAPGLRISAVVARGPAAARLRAARIVEDLFVSGALQEAALELVATPAWRAHLRRLRRTLRERRDALAAAVDEHLGPAGSRLGPLPSGGINLWVRLAPGEDDCELARRAGAAGVIVFPGRPFFAAEPPGPFLRLTYAAEPPERLAEGVRRVAAVT